MLLWECKIVIWFSVLGRADGWMVGSAGLSVGVHALPGTSLSGRPSRRRAAPIRPRSWYTVATGHRFSVLNLRRRSAFRSISARPMFSHTFTGTQLVLLQCNTRFGQQIEKTCVFHQIIAVRSLFVFSVLLRDKKTP